MRLDEAGRNVLKEADSESACAPGRCIVLGGRETREQGRGIGTTDLLVLVGRQAAVGVQLGGERRGDTGGCMRVVAAKQDMSRRRKCQEAREPGWSEVFVYLLSSEPAGFPQEKTKRAATNVCRTSPSK
jgi:hypothetical protein